MKTTSRQLSSFLPMLAAVASSGLLAAAMPSAALAADKTFTPAEILAWGEKTFEGQTAYRVVEREGRPALEARAQG